MSLHTFTIEEKIEVVERLIVSLRHQRNGAAMEQADILRAIAADLRSRGDLPRSLALGELERAIARIKRSHTGLGYSDTAMRAAAETLVNKWPTVRQALEKFGEESVG